jgi:hypothetical protein
VDGSAVVVGYTLSGDANLDGIVNGLDFSALATNFGVGGANLWTQADFNFDGTVDMLDFNAIANSFNESLPSAPPAPVAFGALVPEPMSAALLLPATVLLSRRRRTHRK